VATPASKSAVKTLNGSGGTSVRSPFAHEGATAVYTGGERSSPYDQSSTSVYQGTAVFAARRTLSCIWAK